MLIADKSKPQVQWLRVALYWIWPQVHSCSPQLPTFKHARYLWGAIARYLLGAINFLKSNMCELHTVKSNLSNVNAKELMCPLRQTDMCRAMWMRKSWGVLCTKWITWPPLLDICEYTCSTDQIWSHMNRAVNSRQQLVLIHIVKLLVAKSGLRAKCGRVDMQTGAYSWLYRGGRTAY